MEPATRAERALQAEVRRLRDRITELENARHTALKQAEEAHNNTSAALQEERDRFAALLASMTDEIWYADTDKRFVLANPAAAQEFRLTAEDHPKVEEMAASLEVFRPDGSPRPVEEAPPLRALNGDLVKNEQEIIRTPGSGELKYREVSAAPVRNAAGAIVGSVCVVRDITERKLAEEALQIHRQLLETVLNTMPAAVCLIRGSDLRLQLVNPAYQAIAPGKQMEGRTLDEIWPETGQDFAAICRRVLETGVPHQVVDELNAIRRHPDEQPEAAWFSWSLHRVRLPGEQGWGLVNAAWEATGRKQAEAAARESEGRFRQLVESLPQMVWACRADGPCDYLSPQWLRYTGKPEAQQLGYGWLEQLHPDDREHVLAGWRATAARGENFTIEFRIRRHDGVYRWFRTLALPLRDDAGRIVKWFGSNTDIQDIKEAAEEREQQARLKDEFLALLGHELRNPLATVSTAMQLLANGVSVDRREALHEMMGRQVAVLERLVDDLLDLARISRGQVELQKERTDLSELLQRASAAVRSFVAGRGQELSIRLPAGDVSFLADGVRLEQVVTNLLSNASKYTDRGGKIELSGAQEASEVVIRCKDTGRGIPPGMQRTIFEPFTRGQPTGQSDVPGVGIGLALVKQLVELHGGTVSVESVGPSRGSEFTVRLPLVEPPPALPQARKARYRPRVRQGLSVVVVEDSPDVAQTMVIALEQAGHRVSVFPDGSAALAGLAGQKPDAILIDIGLPGMDGYALAARLRTKQGLKQALFIGLSGFKRRSPADGAKDDFDEYFVKPVDLDRLLRRLNQASRPRG